jgi:hypothetical protein
MSKSLRILLLTVCASTLIGCHSGFPGHPGSGTKLQSSALPAEVPTGLVIGGEAEHPSCEYYESGALKRKPAYRAVECDVQVQPIDGAKVLQEVEQLKSKIGDLDNAFRSIGNRQGGQSVRQPSNRLDSDLVKTELGELKQKMVELLAENKKLLDKVSSQPDEVRRLVETENNKLKSVVADKSKNLETLIDQKIQEVNMGVTSKIKNLCKLKINPSSNLDKNNDINCENI